MLLRSWKYESCYFFYCSLFFLPYSLLENQVVDYHPGVTNLSHQQKIKTKILLMDLILQLLGHLLYFHPWQMVSLKYHSSMQPSKVTNFNATSKMVYTHFVTFRYEIFYGTPIIQCFSKVFIL